MTVLSELWFQIKRNPVLLAGFAAAAQALADGATLRAAGTVLVSFVVRHFVTPEATAQEREVVAYHIGQAQR